MNGKYWDRAWSLVDGCTPCSPGCDNCWSAAMAHRFSGSKLADDDGNPHVVENGRFTGEIILHPDRITTPLLRKKPTVWSIWNDLFHKDVLISFIDNVLGIISACPQHTFLALTKRAHLIEGALYGDFVSNGCRALGGGDSLPNLWIGITVCNQEEADEKIPQLLKAWPGKKWVSIEPMLGPIDIQKYLPCPNQDPLLCRNWSGTCCQCDINRESNEGIDAVVLGGETGPHARPMHPDWVRSVRDQCEAAGVPFFFKQWGEWAPSHQAESYYAKGKEIIFNNMYFRKVGKKAAGRLLDGKEHNDLPWRINEKV